jgi:sugar lactone lactonase YvrE
VVSYFLRYFSSTSTEQISDVADSQSNATNNPGFKQGIRIGSVKDGKVAAFIPEPSAEAGAPEGIGVDDAGNVYAGWTAKMAVRRYALHEAVGVRRSAVDPMVLGGGWTVSTRWNGQ